jgi:2-dehydro-3-deoxygluconokinase
VFSFLQNATAPTAISFATAAGCLAHSIEGDYNLSTREEIESLMQSDGGGRVSR